MVKSPRIECIDKMVKMGVFERDARIYMALLEQRELTAMEIHKLTDVPRTKVYEITQRMIRSGMCIEKQKGGKKKYQAVEPTRVLARLTQEYENELEEKKRLAKSVARMMNPIYNRGSNIVDEEYVEIIKGMPSVHERYVNLLNNTKRELLGFVKRPIMIRGRQKIVSEQENAEFEMLKRGAIARVLYEIPDKKEIESVFAHIKKCIKKGEKARILEGIPLKMYVFDRRHVLMALENTKIPRSPFTMVVIEHTGLARGATMLFDYLWEKAWEVETYISSKKKSRRKGG